MRHRPVRQRWALALLRATRGADLTRLKAFIDDGGRAAAPPACSAAALPSKEIDISVTIGALMRTIATTYVGAGERLVQACGGARISAKRVACLTRACGVPPGTTTLFTRWSTTTCRARCSVRLPRT